MILRVPIFETFFFSLTIGSRNFKILSSRMLSQACQRRLQVVCNEFHLAAARIYTEHRKVASWGTQNLKVYKTLTTFWIEFIAYILRYWSVEVFSNKTDFFWYDHLFENTLVAFLFLKLLTVVEYVSGLAWMETSPVTNIVHSPLINTKGPEQNDGHSTDNILQTNILETTFSIFYHLNSMKFVARHPIYGTWFLVQVMA